MNVLENTCVSMCAGFCVTESGKWNFCGDDEVPSPLTGYTPTNFLEASRALDIIDLFNFCKPGKISQYLI